MGYLEKRKEIVDEIVTQNKERWDLRMAAMDANDHQIHL